MGSIKQVLANLKRFISAMDDVCENAVYIGVPQANTTREGDQPTNAELMYIHTNGSPLMHIPPRPVLQPAVEAYKPQINKKLIEAFEAYKKDEVLGDQKLEEVGIFVSDRCRRWFVDPRNGWAPNAPITLEGGWMRNHKNGKPFYIKGKGKKKNRPLIDTGALRRSITYVVDKR